MLATTRFLSGKRHYYGHRPARGNGPAWFLALFAILLTACGEADESGGLPRPPPGFEQLDPAVQDQYASLLDHLSRLRSASPAAPRLDLARAWGRLGQWFHVYGFPNRATRCYREARELDPGEPRWPFYLGVLAVDDGDLERAGSDLETAADLAPGEVAPLIELAALTAKRQELDRAQAYYDRVLELDPDHPAARIGLARLHLRRQEASDALELLRPLLSTSGRTASDLHYLMAQAYRQLGEDGPAKRHLEQYRASDRIATVLGSNNAWRNELSAMNLSSKYLTRLGMQAYRRGNFRSAAMHSGRAVQSNPDDPELRANYAAALLAHGRSRAALEQIDRALEQDPELARAHLIGGSAHLRVGNLMVARDALMRALSLDPGMKDARRQLGRIYQQQGRTEAAIEQYARLREQSEEVEMARFWHAALLASRNRHAEALAALDADLQVVPRSALLQLLRIRILAAAGDPAARDPARASALLAGLETDRTDVYFAETAAMVAAANGDRVRAIDWQERAVRALDAVRQKASRHIGHRRLVLYRENKTCRTPWEPEEALITKPVATPNGANAGT